MTTTVISPHRDITMNKTDACLVNSMTQYRYYEGRLKTFDNWPKQMVPNKYDLAKCGFTYMGVGDKVKCFHCGVYLKDWERTDNPWNEHYKWSPNCDYIKIVGWTRGIDVVDAEDTSAKPISESKPNGGNYYTFDYYNGSNLF